MRTSRSRRVAAKLPAGMALILIVAFTVSTQYSIAYESWRVLCELRKGCVQFVVFEAERPAPRSMWMPKDELGWRITSGEGFVDTCIYMTMSRPSWDSGNRTIYFKAPIWMMMVPLILVHIALHLRRLRQESWPRCANCDYCLLGNQSGKCPECGELIPHRSARTGSR